MRSNLEYRINKDLCLVLIPLKFKYVRNVTSSDVLVLPAATFLHSVYEDILSLGKSWNSAESQRESLSEVGSGLPERGQRRPGQREFGGCNDAANNEI